MNDEILWPRALRPGGKIGLCSPAGPSPDGGFDLAVERLRAMGYDVVLAPNAAKSHARYGYLAGTRDERLSDLNGLIADESVDLILCARGGYGSAQLLDGLDYETIRRRRIALVGYSDITALSLGILARAGLMSFSGIMATAGDGFGQTNLDDYSVASFFDAIGETPWPKVLFACENDPAWTLHQGAETVSGTLVPVCLTLLESLMGTPYVPNLDGAVLVIEDVHEELYAVDRALTQLRLAGIFERCAGVLIGSFNGYDAEANDRLAAAMPELVLSMVPKRVTVASGIAYGHIPRRFTLPVGARAIVDVLPRTFTFA